MYFRRILAAIFNDAQRGARFARIRSFSGNSRGSLDPAGSSTLIQAGATPGEGPLRDLQRNRSRQSAAGFDPHG
jgi:hypothetical protein